MKNQLLLTLSLTIFFCSNAAFASDVGEKTQNEINFSAILLESGNSQKTLHNEFNRLVNNTEASQDQLDDGSAAPNEAMVALISK